jgi:hypothetical protein
MFNTVMTYSTSLPTSSAPWSRRRGEGERRRPPGKRHNGFLVACHKQNLSQEQALDHGDAHMVNELERRATTASLLRYTRRKYDGGLKFTEQAMKEIDE